MAMMYFCPLDTLSTSSLHFVSSILAHSLLVLGFVEPSPPGLAMQLWLSLLVLRNLVSREFNCLLIDSLSIPTDGAKLMKQNFTSSVCSLFSTMDDLELVSMYLFSTMDNLEFVSMFLVSTMDDLEILYQSKH